MIGFRQHDGCRCGCQHVVGCEGVPWGMWDFVDLWTKPRTDVSDRRLMEDRDKLAGIGVVYYRFAVPRHPDNVAGGHTHLDVAYELAEIPLEH